MRASFTMYPFWNFDYSEHKLSYSRIENKVLIVGGWKEAKNFNVCMQYDCEGGHLCLIHKNTKTEIDEDGNKIEKPDYLSLISADKVIRQPVQIG